MADSSGQGLQQQALRQQYENPAPGYGQQAQYHHQYGLPYHQYPTHMNVHQYHQPVPQHQWAYYNTNSYIRPQPQYQAFRPYHYQHTNSFTQRSVVPVQQPYAGSSRTVTSNAHIIPAHAAPLPHIPPTPPLEPRFTQSPVLPTLFSGHRAPYYPPLPWLSVPGETFPPRQRRLKRRPRAQSSSQPVELPARSSTPHSQHNIAEPLVDNCVTSVDIAVENIHGQISAALSDGVESRAGNSNEEPNAERNVSLETTSPKQKSEAPQRLAAVIPIVPALPSTNKISSLEAQDEVSLGASNKGKEPGSDYKATAEAVQKPDSPIQRNAVKSWAELLKGSKSLQTPASAPTNSSGTLDAPQKRHEMLGLAISSFDISGNDRVAFLEPRGLVNSGNMCYLNSILQVLVFCTPFYNFLSHVSKHAVYSFKSDTPLLDTLILFMKEFSVIDAAESAQKLQLRLKASEMDNFGESLLPEYVYDEIRRMPRFATMQRGHQQDAEEFLGFLFEELQGECARAIRRAQTSGLPTQVSTNHEDDNAAEEGWMEVGPRQKAATTRSSGTVDVDTPINKIFGGQLRSELRVPGVKNSVTLEPYQSLQLDIGSPDVGNIVDALKGLTKPETLHGDFSSPRGSGITATKQVFIEALPPVLILHLKRFQYDNTGGTQKIWKNIGYPLLLEIPREVLPHTKRGGLAARGGLPQYRLISVIYHHGKSATAGHYTSDILRQDGREWLRIDDTFIRRVRSSEVELGCEETSKAVAAALEEQRYGQKEKFMGSDDASSDGGEGAIGKGWSQARMGGKRWSGVVNGTAKSSGVGTPTGPQSLKDNKVAYILLYERTEARNVSGVTSH